MLVKRFGDCGIVPRLGVSGGPMTGRWPWEDMRLCWSMAAVVEVWDCC